MGTTGYYSEDDFHAGEGASLQVGAQLPVADGVLLTSSIGYSIVSGRNALYVSSGIELVLGKKDQSERPVASFLQGDVMLGGQSADLTLSRNISGFGLNLGGYYFLLDRLAIGGSLGANGARADNSVTGTFREFRAVAVGVGLGSRYYLYYPGTHGLVRRGGSFL